MAPNDTPRERGNDDGAQDDPLDGLPTRTTSSGYEVPTRVGHFDLTHSTGKGYVWSAPEGMGTTLDDDARRVRVWRDGPTFDYSVRAGRGNADRPESFRSSGEERHGTYADRQEAIYAAVPVLLELSEEVGADAAQEAQEDAHGGGDGDVRTDGGRVETTEAVEETGYYVVDDAGEVKQGPFDSYAEAERRRSSTTSSHLSVEHIEASTDTSGDEAVGEEVYRVPVEGFGSTYVVATDPEEAVEEARTSATTDDLNLQIDANAAEQTEPVPEASVPDDDHDSDRVAIPEFPSVEDLRRARKRLGYSMPEVARYLDVSASGLGKWERGETAISLEQARDYATVLGRLQRDEEHVLRRLRGGEDA